MLVSYLQLSRVMLTFSSHRTAATNFVVRMACCGFQLQLRENKETRMSRECSFWLCMGLWLFAQVPDEQGRSDEGGGYIGYIYPPKISPSKLFMG